MAGETLGLTIHEPFASWLALGRPWAGMTGPKWGENRTWKPVWGGRPFRGRLAIHAAVASRYVTPKKTLREQYGETLGRALATCRVHSVLHKSWSVNRIADEIRRGEGFPELRGRVKPPADTVADLAADIFAHEHFEGPFFWLLVDFEAIPGTPKVTGRQGLWAWRGGNSIPGGSGDFYASRRKCDAGGSA